MKLSEIVERLGEDAIASYIPEEKLDIVKAASIEEATAGTIAFVEGDKFVKYIAETSASALVLPDDETLQEQVRQRGIAWVSTRHPREVFARTIALLYRPFRPEPGIHDTAAIAPSATLGKNVHIGANVVVHEGVVLGDEVCVHANVVVYPQVTIGDRTVLHANCTVHERTQIGADCTIQSGAVLGAEGFGFVPTPSGLMRMEQSGCVVLEDGVEIGCNSTVDRPSVGETRIGKNTKLDNLVQIGHGCRIGANCAICAQVGLAGGVTLGNNITLAGQVGVANRAKIGDGAVASAKTGIHQDVEAGAVVSGFPAIANPLWLRSAALYKRLPEIYQSLRQIQRRLNNRS
ncbi:UDP-3-O-(3-hydroxymyristoyl)glucosamine N-acyltransferase [Baaleninema simplex]|uniref:UDP-3-O-(3-hydroxymyristoyl)glucosamine N-acyltransferase n=1 Tax=Baaleninema simplex TaxID=2862350 RepID=UPI0003649DE9|nr:UDP-3-O-(3-hydroxymyristoyl)glucosamine N-acyltransferase [Baaleninema simplex]